MGRDIAIIGMAGRFPDAKNLDELFANMKNGKDSTREISKERIRDTTLDPNGNYMVCGYLEDIDKFDYKLFNISLGEACTMGPLQRQLLEVAYETFESSGYGPDYFNGTNTVVYAGASRSDYYNHADKIDPMLISGNAEFYLPAKISRCFNLTGASIYLETACSSSLIAVYAACNELSAGTADYGLACGININIFPHFNPMYAEDDKANIDSQDGKSRSFSANASGMSNGEAVACVLLKPLDKAIMDKDVIYAVIKSAVANNNAASSASPKATSSIAQADMLKKAWKKAGINPENIGYIEAHGSGTKIGDSLEVEGLSLAFREFTEKKNICPISTIKTNIGHNRAAAGISSLVRGVLSLKHKSLFPTVNFTTPNPLIDFKNSAVYVNTEYREWKVEEGKIRYAGVTSLGENGTNCHMVLEEAPVIADEGNKENPGFHLITVSSNSAEGLKRNLGALYKKVSGSDSLKLSDISYTLNTGRMHYKYRFATVADNTGVLLKDIDSLDDEYYKSIKAAQEIRKLIFLFSDYEKIPHTLIEYFKSNYTVFKNSFDECDALCGDRNESFHSFAFQYSFYRLLESYGITSENILGTGIGKIIYMVISGRISLKEGILSTISYRNEEIADLEERVTGLLIREAKEKPLAFISMGPETVISKKIKDKTKDIDDIYVFDLSVPLNSHSPLLEMLKELYLANYSMDWPMFHKNSGGRKIELPTYQFEKNRCWIRDEPKRHLSEATGKFFYGTQISEVSLLVEKDVSDIELKLAGYWRELLGINSFSVNDDFFEIVGDSLKATALINKINSEFGIRLSFEDIFDYPSIRLLGRYINSLLGTEQKLAMYWKEALKTSNVNSTDNFFELGGHSLLATQILNSIRKEFSLELNFEDIFIYPTLGSLADYINNRISKGVYIDTSNNILPAEEKPYYSMSPAQKRMYVLDSLDAMGTSYNTPVAVVMEGKIDKERIGRIFKDLIKRHEILRTSFKTVDGELVQVIHDDIEFEVNFVKLKENEVDSYINEFVKPFDLNKIPLLRITVLELSDDKIILLSDNHHIISDGFSLSILIEDFGRMYKGEKLPDLLIQYKDFSEWQNKFLDSDSISKQKEYWLKTFKGDIPVLEIPTDFPRPSKMNFKGDSYSFLIDGELLAELRELLHKSCSTLFIFVLASLNAFLSRLTGQADIVIGAPIAGRRHAEIMSTIGIFLNTLAIRNFPMQDKNFSEFLQEVKGNCIEAFENQDYQFETLLENLPVKRFPGRNPLFDIVIDSQNMTTNGAREKKDENGMVITPYQIKTNTAAFDIILFPYESADSITIKCDYRTSLFRRLTIEYLMNEYLKLVGQIVKDPSLKLREYAVLQRPGELRRQNRE